MAYHFRVCQTSPWLWWSVVLLVLAGLAAHHGGEVGQEPDFHFEEEVCLFDTVGQRLAPVSSQSTSRIVLAEDEGGSHTALVIDDDVDAIVPSFHPEAVLVWDREVSQFLDLEVSQFVLFVDFLLFFELHDMVECHLQSLILKMSLQFLPSPYWSVTL